MVIHSRAGHYVQTMCQQPYIVYVCNRFTDLYESIIAATSACRGAACVVSTHCWFCLLHCGNVHSGQLGIFDPCDLVLLVR